MREVNMLRRRDAGADRIRFVDIDAPEYDPEENAGISYEQVRLPSRQDYAMYSKTVKLEYDGTAKPFHFLLTSEVA